MACSACLSLCVRCNRQFLTRISRVCHFVFSRQGRFFDWHHVCSSGVLCSFQVTAVMGGPCRNVIPETTHRLCRPVRVRRLNRQFFEVRNQLCFQSCQRGRHKPGRWQTQLDVPGRSQDRTHRDLGVDDIRTSNADHGQSASGQSGPTISNLTQLSLTIILCLKLKSTTRTDFRCLVFLRFLRSEQNL